jgi:tRNA 5-methylaminomethyl-2-thiouridine biosynthesis bifunctional protein
VRAAAQLLPPHDTPAPACWRVLDTRFDAVRLLALWRHWRSLPATGPRILHLVALIPAPPAGSELRAQLALADLPGADRALAEELLAAWWGLLPGQHRIALAGARLQLTLGIGETGALLREQRFAADALWLDPALPWSADGLKAVARCLRRGAAVAGLDAAAAAPPAHALREAGFVRREEGWRFDPPWTLRHEPAAMAVGVPGRCAIVGAGLAGASVAAALARRGWQVQVLDAAAEPASGASGLPVGLLIPYASADDGPRARLTRAGLRLMRAEAQRLLRAGQDWGPGGVLELRLDGRGGLPRDWPSAGLEISRAVELPARAAWCQGVEHVPALWHEQAAWIKPAQLVRAWLAEDGVQFRPLSPVARLHRPPEGTGGWALLDAQGRVLTEAEQIVLANALDAPRLLAALGPSMPAVHGMRGVLSWGLHRLALDAVCPPHPVNGAGSFIPHVPSPEGPAWYAGSTYEASAGPAAPLAAHLQADHDKLRRLLPTAAAVLADDYAQQRVRSWQGLRCVSRDRLPLVGAVQPQAAPGLWLSTAMGSRGLSLAMLCAELLASQLGAEPWPIGARLARHLDLHRGRSGQD